MGQDEMYIMGIDDPAIQFDGISVIEIVKEEINSTLYKMKKRESFKILLSHRPELFQLKLTGARVK